ncbi:MAG TPA: hypothetical protein VHC91_22410 [Trinickia sp.]|uniref:hypothetical protein n=1 Tax=Trinickia sp. TaxID=2571163 RepID=UPI002CE9F63E|nr:hypothetical protein [Trinickia sp.]HVW53118.1 hypothetical protein [Trinickia sp.]
MKKILKTIAVILGACIVGACGNLQSVKLAQFPAQLSGSTIELSTKRPSRADVAPRAYEVPGRSMFFQQTSGGSLAVGLLLGPLGVLANAINTDRITDLMGKSGSHSSVYAVDALTEARAAWPMVKLTSDDAPAAPGAVIVQPFILLYVADEKAGISTVVSARVESSRLSSDEHSKSWIGLYSYVVDGTLPLDALKNPLSSEQLDRYRASVREGYAEIRSELESDLKGGTPPKRQIAWVKSPVLGVGLPGDIDVAQSGRLSLHVSAQNMGPMATPLASYSVFVFPSADQYTFDNGPVDRKTQ